MFCALFDTDRITAPFESVHGNGCTWYELSSGLPSRPSNGRLSTVSHGPQGCSATSTNRLLPQKPSALVDATHRPPMNAGCIGFSAQKRSRNGSARFAFEVQSEPDQYSGMASSWPAGTRASHIFVAECGPLQKPPSRARFCW